MKDRTGQLQDAYMDTIAARRVLEVRLKGGTKCDQEEASRLVSAFTDALLTLITEFQSPMWGDTYLGPLTALPDRGADPTIGSWARVTYALKNRTEGPK